MHSLLARAGVRLLDFKRYVKKTSERVRDASLAEASELERPVRYLKSSRTSKEELARQLFREYPADSGLIAALTTVEPCTSFEYHRSKNESERGLRPRTRKCLHIYKYYMHPVFGFMNVRIQTWFPFSIQICLNGREWLGRQLDAVGASDYRRADNCFTYLGDPELAQRLMDKQLATDWKSALDEIAHWINPIHDEIFEPWPQSYYWCTYQSEWATDIAFSSPAELERLYPRLVRRATLDFHSPDVMRFLGRKCHGRYEGELTTSFKDRAEGVRVKHWADGNSIKMYDKMGSVLRVETTLAKPTPYKVYRARSNDPEGAKSWRPMRKGVADLHRWTEVSRNANQIYLDGLASTEISTPVAEVFDAVSKRRTVEGRAVRALKLNDPEDLAMLDTIARGEFALAGFRNKDLRKWIFRTSASARTTVEARRQSALISRRLRLLRDHGLIKKVPKSYRYRLTDKGHRLVATLQLVRRATLDGLEAVAA